MRGGRRSKIPEVRHVAPVGQTVPRHRGPQILQGFADEKCQTSIRKDYFSKRKAALAIITKTVLDAKPKTLFRVWFIAANAVALVLLSLFFVKRGRAKRS
jgi:hypothetical protein